MKQQINNKQTESDKIPEDWSLTSIGSLVSTISKTFDFSKCNQVVFLNTSDVLEGKVLLHDKITTIGLPGQAKKSIQKGDILFSEIRPKNKRYAFVDFKADDYVVSTKLMVLRTNEKVSSKYFFIYLTSDPILDRLQLLAESRSGTFPQITFAEVSSLDIALPPLPTQNQIADFIELIDRKLELNRMMNKTFEEMGCIFFNKLNSEKTSKRVEIIDFVELNPKEELRKGNDARHVEMKDLPKEGMWTSSDVVKSYKGGSKFRNGDTLMARITPCLENGKSAFIGFLDEGELAFGSTEFVVLRTKNKVFEEYLYYLVRNETFRDFAIKSMVGSSGRQRVQIDAIQHYQLSLPSNNSIEKFHTLMEPIFNQIKANSLENIKLASIRDLLLPRLMSGRLKVN